MIIITLIKQSFFFYLLPLRSSFEEKKMEKLYAIKKL